MKAGQILCYSFLELTYNWHHAENAIKDKDKEEENEKGNLKNALNE